MSKNDVDFIKKNKRDRIGSVSENTYGVSFGHKEHLKADVCFARLNKRLAETPKGTSMQYLLKWDDDSEIVNFTEIMKDMKRIFGHRFSILRYKSGNKGCRIIDIRERRPLPNAELRYIGYYLIFVLLRAIDGEGMQKLIMIQNTPSKGEKISFPIDNWKDLVYIWSRYVQGMGHGINDELYALRPEDKNADNAGSEVLFESAVINYIEVLTTAFGRKFNFRISKKDIEKILENICENNGRYYRGSFEVGNLRCGQTPAFVLLEEIVKERKMKNDNKK